MGLFNFNQEQKIPLPSSRFLQFFYIFRTNFGLLVAASITSFAFFLPLMFSATYSYAQFSLGFDNLDSNSLFSILFISSLIMIPCVILSGLGGMGMNHILKNLMMGEYCKYSDYFHGIKENIKNHIFFYIIHSLTVFLVIFNLAIYLFVDMNPMIKLISLIVSIILFGIISIAKPYYILISMLFENTKFITLKNSIIISTSQLLKNVGMTIVSLSIYILFFWFRGTSKTIVSLLLIIIGSAFYSLINLLNALNVIEKTFDKKQLQGIYHRGLITGNNTNEF